MHDIIVLCGKDRNSYLCDTVPDTLLNRRFLLSMKEVTGKAN